MRKLVLLGVIAFIVFGGGAAIISKWVGKATEQVAGPLTDKAQDVIGEGASALTAEKTKKVSADALADLSKVTVKGRAAKTGYSRDKFGDAWTDNNTAPMGKNGCDTRNDILKRDLTKETFGDAKQCKVLTGTLADKYTGRNITFKYGKATSSAIQIDHVIPLSLAWQQGAQQWTEEKRIKFANDPINLRAADGPTNGAKSDSGPGSWLPPNKSYRCEYVAGFVDVAKAYDLSMNPGDFDAAKRVLTECAK